jgi:hypothetical protein
MDGKLQAAIVIVAVFITAACRPSSSGLKVRCAEARNKGIEFLAAQQRESGGFPAFCWRTTKPEKQRPVDSGFTVSQVLYSITFCRDSPNARGMSERAAAYLVAEQEPPGVWRYFGKARADVISPDVDDTAMAWAALKRFGQPIPAGALDAVRASRNEMGLFNTWIGDPSTWKGIDSRDIDVVVNLNALLFFGLAHETIDKVCDYAVTQAEADTFRHGSLYYSSPLAFTCAFSRAYADGGVDCLRKAVPKIRAATLSLQQGDGGWGNDLETALGALTLLNAGYEGGALERSVNVVIARQMSDGGWALAPAYNGDIGRWRYGSRSLTTAVCVEVLAKYLKR